MSIDNIEERNYIDEFSHYLGWDAPKDKDSIFTMDFQIFLMKKMN